VGPGVYGIRASRADLRRSHLLRQLGNDLLRFVPLRRLIRPPRHQKACYRADHLNEGGSSTEYGYAKFSSLRGIFGMRLQQATRRPALTPDLEEMIRQRAHEIWEHEGRPLGRHEEHWQRAAGEITQELERIKATHTPATAEEIEAPAAPRRGRPRRSQSTEPTTTARPRRSKKAASEDGTAIPSEATSSGSGEAQQDAPRKRGRKAAGEAQAQATGDGATTSRRRVAKGTTGAQSEPATDAAPKPRRGRRPATEVSPEASTAERLARRGRKPKAETDIVQ
jgi:hypothetical protein